MTYSRELTGSGWVLGQVNQPGARWSDSTGTALARPGGGAFSVSPTAFALPTVTDPAGWTTISGTGTVSAGTADATRGAVLQINATAAGAAYRARRLIGKGINTPGRLSGFSFWMRRDANLSVLDLRVLCRSWTSPSEVRWNKGVSMLEAGAWVRVSSTFAEADTDVSSPQISDFQNIIAFDFAVTPTAGNTTTLELAGFELHEVPTPGTVSLLFDDGRLDTFTTAAPIMRGYGFVGSVAPEFQRLGTVPSYAVMSLAQVAQLYAEGWDVLGHDHQTMTGLTAAQQVAVHNGCKQWMKDNGFTRGQDIWVWPGGARNTTTEEIARRYWDFCRAVGAFHTASVPGVVDALRLPHAYVTNTTTPAQLKARIDRVAARGGSLVITFHSLVANKVAAEDYLISDFEQTCADIAASGARVVPVSQVWRNLSPLTP